METHGRTSRRYRAFTALTSAVGIAAVATLAGWTSLTYLSTSAKSAQVSTVQVSTDNVNWSDGTVAAGVTTTDIAADGIFPGQTKYLPIALRVKAGTNTDLPMKVTSSVKTGTGTALTYELITTATFGCAANTAAIISVAPALTSVDNSAPTTKFALPAGTMTTPGGPTFLCLRLTASSTATTVTAPTVVWNFTSSW